MAIRKLKRASWIAVLVAVSLVVGVGLAQRVWQYYRTRPSEVVLYDFERGYEGWDVRSPQAALRDGPVAALNDDPRFVWDGTRSLAVQMVLAPAVAPRVEIFNHRQCRPLLSYRLDAQLYATPGLAGATASFFVLSNAYAERRIESNPVVLADGWNVLSVLLDPARLHDGGLHLLLSPVNRRCIATLGLVIDSTSNEKQEGILFVDNITGRIDPTTVPAADGRVTDRRDDDEGTVGPARVVVYPRRPGGAVSPTLMSLEAYSGFAGDTYVRDSLRRLGHGLLRIKLYPTLGRNLAQLEVGDADPASWQRVERAVLAAREAGWEPVLSLGTWPTSAKSPEHLLQVWAQGAAHAVRFLNRERGLGIRYFELQQDLAGGPPHGIHEAYNVACREMRAADPNIEIVLHRSFLDADLIDWARGNQNDCISTAHPSYDQIIWSRTEPPQDPVLDVGGSLAMWLRDSVRASPAPYRQTWMTGVHEIPPLEGATREARPRWLTLWASVLLRAASQGIDAVFLTYLNGEPSGVIGFAGRPVIDLWPLLQDRAAVTSSAWVPTLWSSPDVEALAFRDLVGSRLSLVLVNRHASARTFEVRFPEDALRGAVEGFVLAGSSGGIRTLESVEHSTNGESSFWEVPAPGWSVSVVRVKLEHRLARIGPDSAFEPGARPHLNESWAAFRNPTMVDTVGGRLLLSSTDSFPAPVAKDRVQVFSDSGTAEADAILVRGRVGAAVPPDEQVIWGIAIPKSLVGRAATKRFLRFAFKTSLSSTGISIGVLDAGGAAGPKVDLASAVHKEPSREDGWQRAEIPVHALLEGSSKRGIGHLVMGMQVSSVPVLETFELLIDDIYFGD